MLRNALITARGFISSSVTDGDNSHVMEVLDDAIKYSTCDTALEPVGRVSGRAMSLGDPVQPMSDHADEEDRNMPIEFNPLPFGFITDEHAGDCHVNTSSSALTAPCTSLALPSSYSFLESNLSRRLHRRSLEIAYGIFSNANSDPSLVFRKFRLVGCMRNRDKMAPRFRSLLCRSTSEALELFGLPYYCIGGAGRHYPRRDTHSRPWFPENVRLPKRILGLSGSDSGLLSSRYDQQIATMGYDGMWLDSYETEEYLKEKRSRFGGRCSVANRFDVDKFVEGECTSQHLRLHTIFADCKKS